VHGNDYDTPDGTCIRDYVHVDDLAAAHLAAFARMEEASAGALAYNLGIGKGFSVLDVIESGKRVTGVAIQYRVGPRRPGDPPRLIADSSAAARDLHWQPRYTDLDDIVATAWRWFSRK
jgi:UDP-glucose 4-epimerase